MIVESLKPIVKSILSTQTHHKLREFIKNRPKRATADQARARFSQASDQASHLSDQDFQHLIKRYLYPPAYRWDPDALAARGNTRCAELLKLPGAGAVKKSLELGCWDGMVSGSLARRGLDATAIDNRDIGFDTRATARGAKLLQMDAANLQFEDSQFDIVFSYDALEHVKSPPDVLKEALRVVRPGGLVYLDFGPLYFSPFGEHAYDSIPIPYCQFLFSEQQINEYVQEAGKPLINFDHVNRWRLKQYRQLWADFGAIAKVVFCCESRDLSHLDLINEYPNHFRTRSDFFEDFLVDNIKILLMKK